MTSADYRKALDAAIAEYEALGRQRRDIDARLAQLAQTINTLTRLLGLTPTVPLGLTDAVRLVAREGVPMSPTDVRDKLRAIGFDLSRYANEVAAVHTILKRLNQSGELRFLPRVGGKPQYIWNRGVSVVALTPDIVRVMHENAAEREAAQATGEPETPRRSGERKRRAGSKSRRA